MEFSIILIEGAKSKRIFALLQQSAIPSNHNHDNVILSMILIVLLLTFTYIIYSSFIYYKGNQVFTKIYFKGMSIIFVLIKIHTFTKICPILWWVFAYLSLYDGSMAENGTKETSIQLFMRLNFAIS